MQPKGVGLFLVILIVIAVTTFMGVALAQQIVPTLDPLALTATEIIARATKAGLTFGTQIPQAQATETWSAYAVTRTTIALTRQPELAQTVTPNNPQLTATRILHETGLTQTSDAGSDTELELTATFIIQKVTQMASELTQNPSLALTRTYISSQHRATSTSSSHGVYRNSMAMTATTIVQYATQTSIALTQNPDLALTIVATQTLPLCPTSLRNDNDLDTSEEIERTLDELEIEVIFADMRSIIIVSGEHGCTEIADVSANLFIEIEAMNLESLEELTKLAEEVVQAVLSSSSLVTYNPETTRLGITFRNSVEMRWRYIETGYDNARQAYLEEGLRGEALIEALGALSPISNLHPNLTAIGSQ